MGHLPLPPRMAAASQRLAMPQDDLITGTYRLAGHRQIVDACRIPLPDGKADDQELLDEVGLSTRRGSFLDRLLYFQMKTYLVGLLMKQDKMSMAASIETRVPFLDHHLVSLAFSLSDHAKVRGTQGKYILKKAAERVLPHDVIYRAKRGFPVPIASLLRAPNNPFIDVLLDPGSLRDGLLDPGYVRGRVDAFKAGADISIELWAMLNLELWRRAFLTSSVQLQAASW
jgi:asparagine synthase (glutamine-hydrolysing)